MAVKLNKKSSTSAAAPATSSAKTSAPIKAKKSTAAPSGGSKFMTGKSAQKALKKAEKESEVRKAQRGKLFEFYLKEDEEAPITFLDGNLDEDGILDSPALYRHEIWNNGKPSYYVCLETNPDWGPCPICESHGNEFPSQFITLFTILDHRKIQGKKGDYQDQRRLLVAKQGTTKLLSKLAQKLGGLAGCTFDVSRTSDKAPRAGDSYLFTEKRELSEIRAIFDKKDDPAVAADYDQELHVFSADDLIEMGFGSGSGVQHTPSPSSQHASTSSYADKL